VPHLHDNIVEQLNASGSPTARYTQGLGIDEPLEVKVGNGSYYYSADGLGSVVALTKSNGSAVNTYFGYNTFGAMPSASETVANPFRFTGREWDPETNLYYYRARYYDPLWGRFLSEDPLQFDVSDNFYLYVGNNPVLFSDPLGWAKCKKRPCDEWLKDILYLSGEISARFEEYNTPKWLLPLTGRNSRAGHLQQLQEKQQNLADEIDDYNKSNCPTPIPVGVEDLATRPLPPLTPSPVHLPPPPNANPRVILGVGASLTTILVIIGAVILSPAGL
jgi:RHS repeat-associated protein